MVGENLLTIFLSGASSLRAALEASPNSLRRFFNLLSIAGKGWCLNPYSILLLRNLEFLLEKDKLKNKADIFLWHHTIKNIITMHRLNNMKTWTILNLNKTLLNPLRDLRLSNFAREREHDTSLINYAC